MEAYYLLFEGVSEGVPGVTRTQSQNSKGEDESWSAQTRRFQCTYDFWYKAKEPNSYYETIESWDFYKILKIDEKEDKHANIKIE